VTATELRDDPPCGGGPLLDPGAPPLCVGFGAVETQSLSDFEAGLAPWTAGTRALQNPATYSGGTWHQTGGLPDGRAGSAAFSADPVVGDCVADNESGVSFLEGPPIVVPADRPVLRIAFDHWVATEAGYDGGNVKASVNGGPYQVVPTARFGFNAYNTTLARQRQHLSDRRRAGMERHRRGIARRQLGSIAARSLRHRRARRHGAPCASSSAWTAATATPAGTSTTCASTPVPTRPRRPRSARRRRTPDVAPRPPGARPSSSPTAEIETRDRLKWTWSKGAATSLVDLGDPRVATTYAVCVWDGRSGVPTLISSSEVPPGTGWTAVGTTGFRYSDPHASVAGISQIRIRTGIDGKASVTVQGKGAALPDPPPATVTTRFEANPAVTVQLVSASGTCWQTAFAPGDLKRNFPPLTQATHVGP
jgi:hypothetical protein